MPIIEHNSPLTWRDKRYKQFYQIVDQLVEEIQAGLRGKDGKTVRRLGEAGLPNLTYSVECIVRDCVSVIYMRKRVGKAVIRLGKHQYQANRPDKMLTYRTHVERAFEGLKQLGYVEVTVRGIFDRQGLKNGQSKSRLTRYVAKDKLLNLFKDIESKAIPAVIPTYADPELLKVRIKERDATGVKRTIRIAFDETDETRSMVERIQVINKALSNHWYDLEISDPDLISLQKRLSDDPDNDKVLRFDRRYIYRVFNDAHFTTGGRFYGGWWQNVPREYRKHIIVNGKPTIELDYSNQHPTILYAWEEAIRPKDCYSGIVQVPELPIGKTASDLRDMVKAAFNAMLNSNKILRNAPDGVQPWLYGMKWSELKEAIMEFHAPIRHHFFTGVGLRLQKADSDIAERVMLHFATKGIAILPLHDSFIMHHGYENELRDVMDAAFVELTGLTPKIDAKEKPTVDVNIGTEMDLPDFENEFAEVLELLKSGHQIRLTAFRSLVLEKS